MTKKKQQEPTPAIDPEDTAFEQEILRRHPTRKHITRFDFPKSIDDVRTVLLFRMTAKDEITAGEMADTMMTDSERKLVHRAMEAERRESLRLSILGVIYEDPDNGHIVRQHVDQSQPFMAMDGWSAQAMAMLRIFFNELNGVPTEEAGNAVRGARKLRVENTASAPHTPAATATRTDG